MAKRVAISGGPGGGKSTVAAAVTRELGAHVVVVPEVATHLLGNFFPPLRDEHDRRALQRAIFHVQLNLEAVFRASADEATVLVFDRGLIDGAAYWPDGAEAFFQDVSCEMSAARDRYDAVLFLESAAQGGLAIDSGNTTRTEQQSEAARLDSILYELWAPHPGFRFIAHTPTFEAKVQSALSALRALIAAG